MNNLALIPANGVELTIAHFPTYQLTPEAIAAKESALEQSALIGKVRTPDAKAEAVRAQQSLKAIESALEKARVKLKEPYLDKGREIDAMVNEQKVELQKEFGRISGLVGEFDQLERIRVADEQRRQQAEADRIERERQAELAKIQREAAEAAAKATNDAQRAQAAAQAAKQAEAVEQAASNAKLIINQPITISSAKGQRTTSDWQIEVLNPFELARCHPNCVDIKPRLTEIKAALNSGVNVAGIKAERVFKAGVALPRAKDAIEV